MTGFHCNTLGAKPRSAHAVWTATKRPGWDHTSFVTSVVPSWHEQSYSNVEYPPEGVGIGTHFVYLQLIQTSWSYMLTTQSHWASRVLPCCHVGFEHEW